MKVLLNQAERPDSSPQQPKAARSSAVAAISAGEARSAGADAHQVHSVQRALVWLLVFFLFSVIGWAYWGHLDVVSVAPGVVVPESSIKRVQHLEGGIVQTVLIEPGQRVSAGQSLILLDALRNETEVAELQSRVEGLLIRIQRLRTEFLESSELTFDPVLQERQPLLVREANTLFRARTERLAGQIRVQQTLLEQHRQRGVEIDARLAANQRVLGFLRQQVEMSERLLQDNLSNRMNHLDLLKELARVEGQIAEDRALREQVRSAIQEAQDQQALLREQFREQAQQELDEAQHSLGALEQRLRKEQDSLARTDVRAPVDGTVKTLHVTTPGEVIAPGGLVAELVPQDDRLVVDARLSPADIGYVNLEQTVRVRMASAEGFRFDPLEGAVEHIGPDTLQDEHGNPYYQIRIGLTDDHFRRGTQIYPIFPGMLVEGSILTGSRSILNYLLQPLLEVRGQALRER